MPWKRVIGRWLEVGETLIRDDPGNLETVIDSMAYQAVESLKEFGRLDPSTNWRLVMEWRLEKME